MRPFTADSAEKGPAGRALPDGAKEQRLASINGIAGPAKIQGDLSSDGKVVLVDSRGDVSNVRHRLKGFAGAVGHRHDVQRIELVEGRDVVVLARNAAQDIDAARDIAAVAMQNGARSANAIVVPGLGTKWATMEEWADDEANDLYALVDGVIEQDAGPESAGAPPSENGHSTARQDGSVGSRGQEPRRSSLRGNGAADDRGSRRGSHSNKADSTASTASTGDPADSPPTLAVRRRRRHQAEAGGVHRRRRRDPGRQTDHDRRYRWRR